MNNARVVLLGDSILDNWSYTRPAPDTATCLAGALGPEWSVELLARDGATISGLPPQLQEIRGRPDRAVVSIGGNDLTAHIGLLGRQSASAAEILGELQAIADDFSRRYEAAARAAVERAERLLLCTIYEVALEPPALAYVARVPLGLVIDRSRRMAARLGCDVLDLRSVCTEQSDFVLQIEPSPRGAAKIAGAIAAVIRDGPPLRSGRLFVSSPSSHGAR